MIDHNSHLVLKCDVVFEISFYWLIRIIVRVEIDFEISKCPILQYLVMTGCDVRFVSSHRSEHGKDGWRVESSPSRR